MKKIYLLIVFTALIQSAFAQNFIEQSPAPPFDGVAVGSISFSDVNGDGYNDVLITGDNSSERIAKLYINEGMGVFSQDLDVPFLGVFQSAAGFSDIDGDGDEDVLITGMSEADRRSSILYTNDGMGNFTEVLDTPFEKVFAGSLAFTDVNGDNYEDVLITGDSNDSTRISKLYVNDGIGNFTEVMNTPFEGVAASDVAFADVNGDGFQDALISGFNNFDQGFAKLYANDGMGNFSEITDSPLEGVVESSVAFSDINGNGFMDVCITGISSSNDNITKIYSNDGQGVFTEILDTMVDGVTGGAIAFSDVNFDGFEDLLVTGLSSSNQRIAKLYTNDGTGNFTEVPDTPFEGVVVSSVGFSDINNDGSEDVIIAGFSAENELISKLYINQDTPSSTKDLIEFTLSPKIYPNPTTLKMLNLELNEIESGFVSLDIFNQNGQLMSSSKAHVTEGKQTLTVNVNQLIPGSYYIQVESENRKGIAKFIVK